MVYANQPENMVRILLLELLPLLQNDAILKNYENTVKVFLDQGADGNDFNDLMQELLLSALLTRNVVIVELLLEYGIDVNSRHALEVPLCVAVSIRCERMVKLLLQHGANVKTFEDIILHEAVQFPCMNIIKLLLEHGANVNVFGIGNWTPLHVSVISCKSDIVKLLLDHGANVNCVNKKGETPLHVLLKKNKNPDISIFRTFIEYGAHVNAVTNYGESVLATAVYNTTTPYDIIKLLLENGAIPDFNNELHFVLDITHPERYHLAELLISYIVFRMFQNREIFDILNRFKTILLVHFVRGSNNYKHFLKIAHSCINEINTMREEFVINETLYEFVSKYFLRTTGYKQSVSLYEIDRLVFLLRTDKYVVCRDLICAAIKYSVIVDRLCELPICYQNSDSEAYVLNYACIDNLIKYMSKGDVINLNIVFYHECFSTYTLKRSAEENEEIVCKKPKKTVA